MPEPQAQYPPALTRDQIERNVATIRNRIVTACRASGRDPGEVRLLPVSKTVPVERLRLAFAAGCRALGENKVQEAQAKALALSDLPIQWSVIGHLQTNKAKQVARFAHEFQALDNLRIAAALDRRLQHEGRGLDVFVQVNSSGEASKFGLAPEDVRAFVAQLPVYTALRVRGLMTLALFSRDPLQVRPCFVRMRRLRELLRQDAPDGLSFEQLSMGMSGDFQIAIEEGATVVRVGQAIFGARDIPDSYYWPEAEQSGR